MADLKLTSFTEEDYNEYLTNWKNDLDMEEQRKGEEIKPEDYTYAFSPLVIGTLDKVDVKELPYDDKLRFLKLCMQTNCISNTCIVSNITILAQGRLIDEELYESDDIFFEDDIEYLDLSNDLREEIKAFNSKIVMYFLAAFKSMNNLISDGAEDIPNLYYTSLASYSLNSMSSAMQKAEVDFNSLPFVTNGRRIVERICAECSFVNKFIDDLLVGVTDELPEE